MTRMLKEFADTLDKRLHRAGGASAQRAERTPVDVAIAVKVLRCVALVIRLLDSFIGRFLPQARRGVCMRVAGAVWVGSCDCMRFAGAVWVGSCVCIHAMLGEFS